MSLGLELLSSTAKLTKLFQTARKQEKTSRFLTLYINPNRDKSKTRYDRVKQYSGQ